jgi:2,3-bisphosphoglycerate-independent phosphoglycerate mutase
MGVDLESGDIAYRCNLVTVEDGVMRDFSAGHITSAEGEQLLAALQKEIPEVFIKSGVSYRNLLVVHNGKGSTSTPPHDIVGKPVAVYLPVGGDSALLITCMEASRRVFATHPVNAARRGSGKPMVTQIWPWSGGKTPQFPLFADKHGKTGGIISAVDLLNGIGRCIGMEIIRVPGATGYLDTDYQAKARYALDRINHLDFLYLHVEAPDEAGHLGSIEEKVRAIERFDGLVGTILGGFDGVIAVLPDHPTPIRVKTHTADPVPFVVRGKGRDATVRFTEREAEKGMFGMQNAIGFLEFLFA